MEYWNFKSPDKATKDDITWFRSGSQVETDAGTIICDKPVPGKDCIVAINPRLRFIQMLSEVMPEVVPPKITYGENVYIDLSARIGSEGFGYEWDGVGNMKFPHIGGVVIGDNVDIGAFTAIDRGTLGDTIIGNGVKIDNHVHIAHNVVVGDHAQIIAGSKIGGSVIIGERAYIGIGALIKQGITIGDGAVIGMGAVVIRDVPASEIWVGNPAKKLG